MLIWRFINPAIIIILYHIIEMKDKAGNSSSRATPRSLSQDPCCSSLSLFCLHGSLSAFGMVPSAPTTTGTTFHVPNLTKFPGHRVLELRSYPLLFPGTAMSTRRHIFIFIRSKRQQPFTCLLKVSVRGSEPW